MTEEGGDLELGVGQVSDRKKVTVQGVEEGGEGGGLAGADIAGDERREAFLEGKSEAALDFLMAVGGKEVGRGGRIAICV